MSKMRARYHELVAQAAKKREEHLALVEKRSKALIDGSEFSQDSEITVLESQINALDAAVMTAHEQARVEERQQQAATEAKLLRLQASKLANLSDEYHDELAKAQFALEEATQALVRVNQLSDAINHIAGPYSGSTFMRVPELDLQNVGHRMSPRIVHTLSILGANGYGQLLWSPRPANAPQQNWAAEDRSLIDRALVYPLGPMNKKAEALEAEARGEGSAE